jgi:phosphinothricin acetyltransferase
MSMLEMRDVQEADLPAVAAIYAHHVLHGLASFEEAPPGVDEIRRRFDAVRDLGLPYLACVERGQFIGYAYATLFRTRSAYRYTLEDSVYVKAGLTRKGIGRQLLSALLERSTALGYRQMVAVIGDSANASSIELHAALGFVRCGLLRSTGYKFGRWVDTVMMQRPLGPGDGAPPLP